MNNDNLNVRKHVRSIFEYLIALIANGLIGAVCFPFSQTIGYQSVGFIFLMSIPILSLFLGRGPVLLASVLNFAVWNFFFIPPILTFHIGSIHDQIALLAYFVVALSSGILITRIRKNQLYLTRSQERIRIINSLLESLNHAGSIRDVVTRTSQVVKKEFSAEMIVYLKDKDGTQLSEKTFGNLKLFSPEGFELAKQVLNGIEVPATRIQYFPLTVQRGNIGVLGVQYHLDKSPDEQTSLLMRSFVAQITSALDREINIDIAKEQEIFVESQKLFQTVLSSVSHELRTPIAIISTAVSSLDDEKTASNPEIRGRICVELNSAAKRLNILVENILDMSRIETGYIQLNKQPFDLIELVGMAINEVKPDFGNQNVHLNILESLPTVLIDIHWFKQAIINILRNALRYNPPDSDLFIEAFAIDEANVQLEIQDNGTGVPEASLTKIFDKFYRVPGSRSGGTGLGLAISKAIVEAHNGTIYARNRESGGLSVIINLRIEKDVRPRK
jgi:two-component system, OmpR family, sensor histidine kinase KdpD